MQTDEPVQLVEHFCRHESARLVATLTGRFGVRYLDLVEDVVQGALIRALRSWPLHGIPSQPAAWLYRVAYNMALDQLRRDLRWNPLNADSSTSQLSYSDESISYCEQEVSDSQLRMIFACCNEEIPRESQVALALKTLSGFGNSEIARALLMSEANIAKRLGRAKQKLRTLKFDPYSLDERDIQSRLPMVHTVAYLVFNEGYCSTHDDRLVREELCEEAVRLAMILAEHPLTRGPTSSALIALMLFHASRLETRLDETGRLLRMADQDRSRWDYRLIQKASSWMSKACEGEISRYHVEAWIASEHCTARTYADTNWQRITDAYELLRQFDDSPVVELNRAIAIAESIGLPQAWSILKAIDHSFQESSHLWSATAAEFAIREHDREAAMMHLQNAIKLVTAKSEKEFLSDRLDDVANSPASS